MHNLSLNEKTQIFTLRDGINFLGYRFIVKNKKIIVLPNRKNYRNIRRRSRKCNDIRKRYNGYLQDLSINHNRLILSDPK